MILDGTSRNVIDLEVVYAGEKTARRYVLSVWVHCSTTNDLTVVK